MEDIINIITPILTIITIILIVYWNKKQYIQINRSLTLQNEKIKLNFFSEYTRRYQEIVSNLPSDITTDEFQIEKLDTNEKEKTMRYIKVYFDLCSEEFYLYENKFIDLIVWDEWEKGIMYMFQRPFINRTWKNYGNYADFYSNFKKYIDNNLYALAQPGVQANNQVLTS